MILRDDERAALAELLQRRRVPLVEEQRHVEQRKRRIAAWAGAAGPLMPRLVGAVGDDLRAYGLDLSTHRSLPVRIVNRLAMVGAVREATAAAQLRNVAWVREDAFHAALAEVHSIVAARTGNLLRWVTEDDDRVCAVCEPRHGVTFAPASAPRLPAHPRCRCWLVAVSAALAAAA